MEYSMKTKIKKMNLHQTYQLPRRNEDISDNKL